MEIFPPPLIPDFKVVEFDHFSYNKCSLAVVCIEHIGMDRLHKLESGDNDRKLLK